MTRTLGADDAVWSPWIDGGEDRPGTARACPRPRPSTAGPGPRRAGRRADVDRAVAVADAAAAPTAGRRGTSGQWLRKARTSSTTSRPTVETLIALVGKPRRMSALEVSRGVALLRQCAEEISRLHGENLTLDGVPGGDGRWGLTCREPYGVVAASRRSTLPST